ncbi:tRNA glutamyl-Q(34) synthetase GluQRS [Notoacmeibacter ruber]|uniref:tRNA glutamyl-Q(34) synthetase GluQRS n=1 Tax=Notoacmeibacter ruber TaxID=2670375 RepID=A0A3L7JG62_9HYPH|nr:tRNA glutamyl-Q(34) synthetase GluQRS [Notoacmeibacter ruber]RLQ88601.1 tRNA glutamyl-Q(34) synthetase GluQRS [Notoacmeibacter ruber]
MTNAPANQPIFRFAPSPNGALHLGHARSAILNNQAARVAGGRLLLRMEDIDRTRCSPELEQAILDDLVWLGIDFEEGIRRQSDHFASYKERLEQLSNLGLVYPSFTTRGELRRLVADVEAAGGDWPRDPDGTPHPPLSEKTRTTAERHKLIETGHPYAWRLDMKAALQRLGWKEVSWRESATPLEKPQTARFDARLWGDVVLARKDIPTSYHLAVVLDDAQQGVSHIIRGRDLYPATAIHRVLQALLALPEPIYHHHALVLDEDGRKLSKSIGSAALSAQRLGGYEPQETIALALGAKEAVKPVTLPKTYG